MSRSKDTRWRRVKVAPDGPMPTYLAVMGEDAMDLARLTGKASTRIEALEAVYATAMGEWLQEVLQMERWGAPEAQEQAREYWFRSAVRRRDGHVCQLCDHTTGVEVHHCVPRDECRKRDRLDLLTDPRNGICLCPACHAKIGPVWREYLPSFEAKIAENAAAGGRLPAGVKSLLAELEGR